MTYSAQRDTAIQLSRAVSLILVLASCARAATVETQAADVDVATIIDGIVARAEVIHNVKLRYDYHGESSHDDPSHSKSPSQRQTLVLTVQGQDWLLRHPGNNNFRMRRDDATLNFAETVESDRPPTRTLEIVAPVTLPNLLHEHAAHAGPRLGTVWFAEQAEFCDGQRDSARPMTATTVNGVATYVVEWKVAATEFDRALLVITPKIAKARQGVLRLYTASELNWALPRIEYLAPDGTVELRIDADRFQRYADDIYFPHHAVCTTYSGGETERSEYTVHTVEFVNSALPAAEFKLNIPAQTRVRDSRPGVPTSVFSLDNQEQFEQVNQALSGSVDAGSRWSFRRVALIANLTVLGICLIIWSFRRWSAK